MPLASSYARAPIGNVPGWGVTRRTFATLEEFIADMQGSKQKATQGLDLILHLITLTTKGFAQERSAGPVAPRQRSVPALAHRIPVQRISGAYFAGWTQRRIGPMHWLLYNDSVEAYLIEEGIYQRTRRPILKMSVIDMLRFLQTTRTGDRFLDYVLAPRRNAKGQFQSFNTRIRPFKMNMAPAGRGANNPNISGPVGSLP